MTRTHDKCEDIQATVLSSIHEVDPEDWDICAGNDNPFISHAFLSSLEDSNSTGIAVGWMPKHIVIEDSDGCILGATPLYLKNHSYGEYVFDWGWADAYEQAGGRYYPKLQCSVPFTPVTGPRLLVSPRVPEIECIRLRQSLAATMVKLAQRLDVSSVHITFLEQSESQIIPELGYMQRIGQQFHWENKNYSNFDDFLNGLVSRKRKQLRKERQRVKETGLTFRILRGAEITEAYWDSFYQFYRNTTEKKWGPSYLTREFFPLLSERLGDAVLLIFVEDAGKPVAGALNLLGSDTVFGRNWGCKGNYKFLHFETCYYQAIEFAIQNKFRWVEAGAQGPHKIQRGYLPNTTYSAHWIADPNLRHGIERFLIEERRMIRAEITALTNLSPYKVIEN